MALIDDCTTYRRELAEYEAWIEPRDPHEWRIWRDRLRSDNPGGIEASVVESLAWRHLRSRVDGIEPYLPGSGTVRRPDFLCTTGGSSFVIEVTCLTRESVTEHTTLAPEVPQEQGFRSYRPMDGLLKSKLMAKTAQGDGLRIPYVVFAGTLHTQASGLLVERTHLAEFLRSRTMLRARVDFEQEGPADVEHVTDLRMTPFAWSLTSTGSRKNVSAMLVGGFGIVDPHVFGMFHPEAIRPLGDSSIRDMAFARYVEWPLLNGDEVRIAWSDGVGDE